MKFFTRDTFRNPEPPDKSFADLRPGDKFHLRVSKTVFTKKENSMAESEDGEQKYFPDKMPVIPIKKS